jgi:vacuolar protein sorting-associated protein 13A/C
LAVLTIDSPQIIFAVDPVFALLQFFARPISPSPQTPPQTATINEVQTIPEETPPSQFDFRVDLHDVSISILENETDPQCQAIKLHIGQVLLSQQVCPFNSRIRGGYLSISQGVLALTVNRLGMSLMRMGRYSEVVRFLDNLDFTASLDSRSSSSQQMSNIEVTMKPVVLRALYRDINLIMSIVNRAIELYTKSQQSTAPPTDSHSLVSSARPKSRPEGVSVVTPGSKDHTQGKATVTMSKEQVSFQTQT